MPAPDDLASDPHPAAVYAAPARPPALSAGPDRSRTVSLVLGSGGARGLAHIGVIGWLVEHGYHIESIAGSSIGALIGGIHAAGQLAVYEDWVRALERLQVLRLLDPTLGRPGLFKGERIIGVLRDLIGDRHIEDLPIRFTAVATELGSGEEVWLRDGPLFDAIRASIATPLVFAPVRRGGRTLLDGAVVNPVPMAPVAGDGTALTIAVDLSGPALPEPPPAPRDTPHGDREHRRRVLRFVDKLRPASRPRERSHGFFDVAFLSMQAMQDTITRLRLTQGQPDVMIEIPRNACGFLEFWRAEEMIALGRRCAEQAFVRSGFWLPPAPAPAPGPMSFSAGPAGDQR